MISSRRYLLGAGLILAAALATQRATADKREREHDAIRSAVERGEARPLAEIAAAVRGKLPGEIVGVKAERKEGHWVYEFRVVDGKGRLFDAYVNAQTGEVERVKEK